MKRTLTCAFGAFALLSSAAMAEAPGDDSGMYLAINGGISKSPRSRINDSLRHFSKTMKSSSKPVFGGGIGYYFDENFRADIMLNYRNLANKTIHTGYVNTDGIKIAYTGKAKVNSLNPMLTLYYDLGDMGVFTPYIGAGAGMARNKSSVTLVTTDSLDGQNIVNPFTNHTSKAKTNVAYQLTAGSAINLSENFDLDAAYRYLYAGHYKQGMIDPINSDLIVYTKRLKAHELTLGLRYSF